MDIEKLIKSTTREIRPYRPGKPIAEVKRELGLKRVYKLASNENPLGPSPKAIAAIKRASIDINRYPESGCFYLKERLAEIYGLEPDNFVIGNGSDELIALTLRTFLNPGDEVIVSKPTFLMYEFYSKMEGANLKIVPMNNFKYDLDAILDVVTDKTKIIFIANPDNPCGTYVTKNEIERFIDRLPSDVILFHDEAYYEFMQMDDYPDLFGYIKNKPVIIARTFSKVYGLAGLRIGYGIADKRVAEHINKVRDPFNVNSLAQAGALAALDDRDFVEKVVKLTKENREYLFKEFERLGLNYVRSYTNCIIVEIGDRAQDLLSYLLKNGIIVRDMSVWGLNKHIRVSVGLKHENREFVKLLEEFIKKEIKK
ncbi:MAG: histidinol-phosphate transaminase [Candidatus Kaelpia aquatica]|nr:histidinol-phosphate transaminase [Candidatus Kaelpia aquatica]